MNKKILNSYLPHSYEGFMPSQMVIDGTEVSTSDVLDRPKIKTWFKDASNKMAFLQDEQIKMVKI